MFRKFNINRKFLDNFKLGGLIVFVVGMVNVFLLMIFFVFIFNVMGYFVIFVEEIFKGNWYQVVIVLLWVVCFYFGNFIFGFIIIYWGQICCLFVYVVLLILEIVIFVFVGIYGLFYYKEILWEIEMMVVVMFFLMGLQNGFIVSILNFVIKIIYFMGFIIDFGVLSVMFIK